MPRICHVIFEHPLFDARVFHKQAVSLAQAGWEVCILAPQVKPGTLGRKAELELKEAPYVRHDVRFYPYTYPKYLPRELGLRNAAALRSLFAQLRRLNPDVVQFHEDIPMMLLAAARLKDELPGAKLVFDFHEFYLHRLRTSKRKRKLGFLRRYLELENEILTHAGLILCVGAPMKTYYRSLTNCPILVVNNVQSRELYHETFLPEIDSSKTWYVMEGNFFFDRGVKVIFQALRAVAGQDIGLIVAGMIPGPEQAWVDDFIAKNALRQSVVLTGRLKSLESASWIHVAHAGLSICLAANARMGYPNKVFNYITLGRPVITDADSGSAKLVRKTGAGIVLRRNTPEELAEAMLRLKNDEALYEELCKKTRRAYERYNWDSTARRLVKAMNRLVQEGGEDPKNA